MLEGESIICFAHDWESDPTSKTHIMSILSRRNRVLWVSSIGMRRPAASRADLARMASKLRRCLAGARRAAPNLIVANPIAIPLPGFPMADRLNAALLAGWLRRLCRRHGLSRPILWSYLPNVARLAGRLGERMLVYHCVDEYRAFKGVQREAISRMEDELLRRADLVLVSSETLRDERRRINPNTYFIPHGVDLAHFSRALDTATPVPSDLASLPRPVVGFFGLIAEWVDLSLVRSVALAQPDWSIVLIGRIATDLAPLEGLSNVHLLGPRPYGELPAYCRGFDAGIVPFRMSELTLRANPLKLREYLAAGLPVVSTPLPEVARYEGLVHLAAGETEFVACLEEALARRTEADARRRVEAMRAEGWERRVEEISEILVPMLEAA